MKTYLLWVGKTTDKALDGMIADYVNRIAHYVPFEVKTLPALKNAQNMSVEQQKEAEGTMLLAAIDELSGSKKGSRGAAACVVLLDERGAERRSIEFARYLQNKQSAARDLVFVIGGPYGFSQSVYERADESVSLSKMTFSHQMIRLLFTEQLYRALTILHGEKYHHE